MNLMDASTRRRRKERHETTSSEITDERELLKSTALRFPTPQSHIPISPQKLVHVPKEVSGSSEKEWRREGKSQKRNESNAEMEGVAKRTPTTHLTR